MQQIPHKKYFLLHIPMMSLTRDQIRGKDNWLPHSSKYIPGFSVARACCCKP